MRHYQLHKRKGPSRRRLKARFMLGRPIALEDVYENRLVNFIVAHRYTTSTNACVMRLPPKGTRWER